MKSRVEELSASMEQHPEGGYLKRIFEVSIKLNYLECTYGQ